MSALAAFLGLAVVPGGEPGTTRMELGPHTRNSYGATIGGAVATLVVESARRALPERGVRRIHVRFLAGTRQGYVLAAPRVVGTCCEVLVTDQQQRTAAFGVVHLQPLAQAEEPAASSPYRPPAGAWRRWGHVPLLDALDIAEGAAPDGEMGFEMPPSAVASDDDGGSHPGAIFTLVDLAAGQFAQRSEPPGPVVTLDAEVRMLAVPGKGALRAQATALHAGRRVVTCGVVVEDATREVARATVAMLRVGELSG